MGRQSGEAREPRGMQRQRWMGTPACSRIVDRPSSPPPPSPCLGGGRAWRGAAIPWAARRAARCAARQRQQARHSTWGCSKSARRAPRRRSTSRQVRRGARAPPGHLSTCLLGWLLARRTASTEPLPSMEPAASTEPLPSVRALCRSCRPRPRRRHRPRTSGALGWATAATELNVPRPLACSSSPAMPSPSTCSPPSGSSHGVPRGG
jgi:hypothetical protein